MLLLVLILKEHQASGILNRGIEIKVQIEKLIYNNNNKLV